MKHAVLNTRDLKWNPQERKFFIHQSELPNGFEFKQVGEEVFCFVTSHRTGNTIRFDMYDIDEGGAYFNVFPQFENESVNDITLTVGGDP